MVDERAAMVAGESVTFLYAYAHLIFPLSPLPDNSRRRP